MTDKQGVPAGFAPALARLDGDITLLRAMAVITSEDLPAVQSEIEAAIDEADCVQTATALHRIKGMLSTFQSDGIVLDIQEIVDLARQRRGKEMTTLYRKHKPRIDDLIERIREVASTAD